MIVLIAVFRLEEGQSGEQVLCRAEICCPVCALNNSLPPSMRGRIAFQEVVLGHCTSGGFEPFLNSGIVTTSSCPFCCTMVEMNDALVQRLLFQAEEWRRQFLEARSAQALCVS